MSIDILIEDPRWHDANLHALADVAFDATLGHLGLDPQAFEIALLACDDERIASLNAQFRGKPTPTNVLSWPSAERGAEREGGAPVAPELPFDAELGDVAISFDTCVRESLAAEKPFADHVTHLLVHGILHVLGYDHVRDADATLMERIEIEILGKLGMDDPYSDNGAPDAFNGQD